MELSLIKNIVQHTAEAITAALEIETEIVDSHLKIIGGTGRYKEKIDSYEEDGDVNGSRIYAKLLRSGSFYVCLDSTNDSFYDAKENELAEICYPIKIDDRIIGLIGLVAFTDEQKSRIIKKETTLIDFLKIMSELIAGRYLVEVNNDSLKEMLSSALNISLDDSGFGAIIGESSMMQDLKKRALQVASGDSTILITGESGTGKELFARAIHSSSYRNNKPFISINCGAIPESLLESELFGYEKGSFTGAEVNGKAGKFQLADGGTVFLDEIGDMPMHLQAKLLRVLQTRQIDKIGGLMPIDVDIRIIAATNKNLEELIEKKQFREDLYFRLSVIPLAIPPLREHPEDIDSLIKHAFNKFKSKLEKSTKGISSEAYGCLLNYSWPGNVRELENSMEYSLNIEDNEYIQRENLPERIRNQKSDMIPDDFKGKSRDFEKQLIIDCLDKTGWSVDGKRKAAKLLGISESTLYRRLRA